MNTETKFALLTTTLVLGITANSIAGAAVATFSSVSNAVNYCQALRPSNMVRNKVLGIENTGNANINVSCNFESMYNGAPNWSFPTSIVIYFSNTSTTSVSISCTLLTGFQGSVDSYAVTKSLSVPSGGTSNDGYSLSWNPTDNPKPGATDLGHQLIGVNCALPHGGVINDIHVNQQLDNGVGD